MKKTASILDYSYPFLDPAVWDHEQKLYSYHKDFILRLLSTMYETYQLKQPELWIKDIRIIGSLTTSKWLFTSDMDVHMLVDLAKFIETNMPGTDPKTAYEYLDSTRKEFDRAKILAPMTQHPIEYYFEVPEFITTNTSMVGVYSISTDAWLKEPVIFPADLDFEESKKQVMAQAEEIAESLDGSFGRIDRQIDRITELEHVIGAWDQNKQQIFYNKIEEKLKGIEVEILKDIELRQALIDARHAAQDPMADIEIKFKWLQRFGFFGILSNLKTLMQQTGGQVTLEELPLIKKIVTESSLEKVAYEESIWIDPKGTYYPAPNTHGMWIAQNSKLLKKKYNLDFGLIPEDLDDPNTTEDELNDATLDLVAKGWCRVFLADSVNFQIASLSNLNPAFEKAFIDATSGNDHQVFVEDLNGDHVEVTEPELGFVKSVQKAQQTKRIGSLKEAFLKEAFEDEPKETDTDICVDFDRTIAQPAKHPAIGEPIEGAKESLAKLKDLGYNVIIYSCRGDTEEGLKAMEEWLDKHDMPYDSIFSGEKPFFKYLIDDRAIHFDSWDKVIQKVEKSEKNASLIIAAQWPEAFWIAPDGKSYEVPYGRTHDEWLVKSTDLLKKQYGVDFRGAYGEAFDDNVGEMVDALITYGWARVGLAMNHRDYIVQINDIRSVPNSVIDYLLGGPDGMNITFENVSNTESVTVTKDDLVNGQKAINKAIRMQRSSKLFSKIDITAKTKKVKQGDYSCLMALVPHELAQEIVEWGVRNVPDEDLYLNEGGRFGRELESHVTIKYGLLTNDAKYVRRSFNDAKPFHAKLGKVRHFEPPELPFDVLTVEVISEDLSKANKMVCDKFDCAEGLVSDEYKSHITIAYMKRGKATDYIGYDGFEGKELDLDTLIFSPRKGNRTYFSVSSDKESSFILHEINKFAYAPGNWAESAWISPSGEVFDLEGDSHEDAIFDLIGDEEIYNVEDPLTYAINKGWTRFGEMGGGGETGANVQDLRNINPAVFSHAIKYTGQNKEMVVADSSGKYVHMPVDEFVLGQNAVNKALSNTPKTAEFLPSLFQAPDNRWQFEHGGDDKEIALNPDSVSDETTWYAPCTEGKPRSKDVWRQFMSIFRNPFSKKEEMTVDSAYDPALEEANKKALGEDETALDYSKGFYDPKKHDFPHNTTWDSLVQDGEPSKPTSVTYSPQISNEDNLDQNSPGGFPRRFMGKPKGEWFSDEGEIVPALKNMWKSRTSAVENVTLEIIAGSQSASVPDYLIDEWKTEQIMNDTDEEPYVNHDQRDYPYGMHDSPENTGYNIGWPKDNQRAVVRLDTLENPAYRLDPFGIGEYNVTWYTSLPASDGIEKMNPE